MKTIKINTPEICGKTNFLRRFGSLTISFLIMVISVNGKPGVNSAKQLIDSVYGIRSKPFLLLNYVSTDCINCRAGTSGMLNRLSKMIDSNNIEVLIDDRNTKIDLNRLPEVYGKYKITVNEQLSKSLAEDGRCGLFLVSPNSLQHYSTKYLNDSLVFLIVEQYKLAGKSEIKEDRVKTTNKEFACRDTIFEKYGALFEACDRGILLFSPRFQVGHFVNAKSGNSGYFEFGICPKTMDKLNDMVTEYHPSNFINSESSARILKSYGLPVVYVESIRLKSNTCYTVFQYKTVETGDKSKTGEDNYNVKTRLFLGVIDLDKEGGIESIQDISKYSRFYFLDSFSSGEKVYEADLAYGFDVNNDQAIMRAREYNSGQNSGKPADSLYYFNFTMAHGNKLAPGSRYAMDGSHKYDEMHIHIDEAYRPVVNINRLSFLEPAGNQLQSLPIDLKSMNISYVYDWKLEKNMLEFIGISDKKTYYYSYNLATKSTGKLFLAEHVFFGGMKILESGKFIGYEKNKETDNLKVSEFDIRDL